MDGLFTIDEIKTTKKGRYALFCDGEFLFSVDEETLVKHAIEPGTVLTKEEKEALGRESTLHAAREKAYMYLTMRDYGENELYGRLLKDFDPYTCAAVVARLRELGLLDDGKFAAKYAEELKNKGKSRTEIRNKLREKGLDRDLIDSLTCEDSDETDVIRGIIESGYLRKLRSENGYRKVYAALIRRGFRSSDVRRALAFYTADEEEEYYE